MLMLETFFPASVTSVDVGAGILGVLAYLACCLSCSVVGELLGVHHCVLRLHNV